MTGPMDTASYRVEQFGPWRPEQIQIHFEQREFQPEPSQPDLIDQSWRQQQAEARIRGFEMFNGKLARLISSCSRPAGSPQDDAAGALTAQPTLQLTIQPTDFRTFMATNLVAAERFTARADAMGISSIVRTSDNRLLFGRRSQQVAYNRGKLHTIGGVLDWIRPAGGGNIADGNWLHDQLLKELYEELTLQPEDISRVDFMLLARDKRIWQPELLCVTDVALSASELSARWRESREYEHDELWSCPDSAAAAVDAMARHVGQMTPLGRAAMVGYISIRYGWQAVMAIGDG